MSNYKNFKDFNIEPVLSNFTGDKLHEADLLNTTITVFAFVIEDSTKKPGTKRLKIQLEKDGKKHIYFSGSTILRQQIEKVPKENFPFITKIVKESKHLKFT
jgi:hypothetical protein